MSFPLLQNSKSFQIPTPTNKANISYGNVHGDRELTEQSERINESTAPIYAVTESSSHIVLAKISVFTMHIYHILLYKTYISDCSLIYSTHPPRGAKPGYEKTAPQLLHRRSRMARQQRMPMGKNQKAQQSPASVKSSLRTPTLHAGQPPTMITSVACTGWTTTGMLPYVVCWLTKVVLLVGAVAAKPTGGGGGVGWYGGGGPAGGP